MGRWSENPPLKSNFKRKHKGRDQKGAKDTQPQGLKREKKWPWATARMGRHGALRVNRQQPPSHTISLFPFTLLPKN